MDLFSIITCENIIGSSSSSMFMSDSYRYITKYENIIGFLTLKYLLNVTSTSSAYRYITKYENIIGFLTLKYLLNVTSTSSAWEYWVIGFIKISSWWCGSSMIGCSWVIKSW